MLRDVHKPRQIHNLLSRHTHLLPNRHNRDSYYLGDPRLRNTSSHTHLTPPEILGHVSEMDAAWHTLRQIRGTHPYAGAHTNPHRLITHRRRHPRESTHPPLPGGHRHTSSPSRYPNGLVYKESGRGPCTHTYPGLVDVHPGDTHADTQPCAQKQGHEHRALTRQACSLC